MPLKEGYSRKVIATNVREMIGAGQSKKQVAAAVLGSARKSAKNEAQKQNKITVASVMRKKRK